MAETSVLEEIDLLEGKTLELNIIDKTFPLYGVLLKMEEKARAGDEEAVRKINREEFSPLYNEIFKDVPYVEGSLKCLCDRTRNCWLNLVGNDTAPTPEREEYLKKKGDLNRSQISYIIKNQSQTYNYNQNPNCLEHNA